MTAADEFMTALTAWRENRGGGRAGMQSVMNAIMNRARKHGSTPYAECVKRLQFSSITAKGDPELTLWPEENDPVWAAAREMAQQAMAGSLEDITGGAIDYYAPRGIVTTQTIELPSGLTVPFPEHWDRTKVRFTQAIASQLFFVEV